MPRVPYKMFLIKHTECSFREHRDTSKKSILFYRYSRLYNSWGILSFGIEKEGVFRYFWLNFTLIMEGFLNLQFKNLRSIEFSTKISLSFYETLSFFRLSFWASVQKKSLF